VEGRLEGTKETKFEGTTKVKVIKVGRATKVPLGTVLDERVDPDTGETILKVQLFKSGEITEVSERSWRVLTR